MITKTYIDGRLNQLEEKLKRGIEAKDEKTFHEMEIRNLKENVELLKEKIEENKDIINNYLSEHNDLEDEIKELKDKIYNLENSAEFEKGIKTENEDDSIVSDI